MIKKTQKTKSEKTLKKTRVNGAALTSICHDQKFMLKTEYINTTARHYMNFINQILLYNKCTFIQTYMTLTVANKHKIWNDNWSLKKKKRKCEFIHADIHKNDCQAYTCKRFKESHIYFMVKKKIELMLTLYIKKVTQVYLMNAFSYKLHAVVTQ